MPLFKDAWNGIWARNDRRRGRRRIARYFAALPQGGEARVIFGNHWSKPAGWLILKGRHQDITKPLAFADASVDAVFTENVVEHIDAAEGLRFFREAFRILKPGGIVRIVCPMLDRMLQEDFSGRQAQAYFRDYYLPQLAETDALLKEIGMGVEQARQLFVLNLVMRDYGHKFIWTSELLAEVLRRTGFREASRMPIGQGARADYCIERRRTDLGKKMDVSLEKPGDSPVFNTESYAVEARK